VAGRICYFISSYLIFYFSIHPSLCKKEADSLLKIFAAITGNYTLLLFFVCFLGIDYYFALGRASFSPSSEGDGRSPLMTFGAEARFLANGLQVTLIS
jgi:hypothetical protein